MTMMLLKFIQNDTNLIFINQRKSNEKREEKKEEKEEKKF